MAIQNDQGASYKSAPMWYVFRVQSSKEDKMISMLKMNFKNLTSEGINPNDFLLEFSVPKKSIITYSGGKKNESLVPFYPGYLFIKAIMTPKIHMFLKSIVKNLSLIDKPLTDEEYFRMIAVIDNNKTNASQDFSIGHSVQFVSGTFNTFTGIVKSIDEEKKKMKVSVAFFGQDLDVDADFSDVKIAEK